MSSCNIVVIATHRQTIIAKLNLEYHPVNECWYSERAIIKFL